MAFLKSLFLLIYLLFLVFLTDLCIQSIKDVVGLGWVGQLELGRKNVYISRLMDIKTGDIRSSYLVIIFYIYKMDRIYCLSINLISIGVVAGVV